VFSPSPWKGEGEDSVKRGFAPLKHPSCGYLVKGLKGTYVPLTNYLPLPLIREGGQGDRLIDDLLMLP